MFDGDQFQLIALYQIQDYASRIRLVRIGPTWPWRRRGKLQHRARNTYTMSHPSYTRRVPFYDPDRGETEFQCNLQDMLWRKAHMRRISIRRRDQTKEQATHESRQAYPASVPG